MSIDARVETAIRNNDGSGELRLVDRPKRYPGDRLGIAGQQALSFDSAPCDVTALNGQDIWGGSSDIRLGDRKIAIREGYTKIRFVVSSLLEAVRASNHQEQQQ